jgi:hypothetical protein
MTIEKYGDDNFHNQARKIRYNFFNDLVKKYDANYLMTAHHGDDLVETVLMRIVRGSTLKGYSGFNKIMENDGYVAGMKFEIMELGEPDQSGRRSPVGTGRYKDIDVDTVIVALGTGPNPIIQKSASDDGIEFETDKRGYFVVNEDTRETSVPTIFAGGDVAPVGASNAINAMGAGKKAAKAINEILAKDC